MHCDVFEDGSPSFHTKKILCWALYAAVAHCYTVAPFPWATTVLSHTGTHGHTHTQQALIMSFLDLACHNYTFAGWSKCDDSVYLSGEHVLADSYAGATPVTVLNTQLSKWLRAEAGGGFRQGEGHAHCALMHFWEFADPQRVPSWFSVCCFLSQFANQCKYAWKWRF